MNSGYITINDIADEYQISRQTIWRLVTSNAIPSVRIGRSHRISREAWEKYLRRNGSLNE